MLQYEVAEMVCKDRPIVLRCLRSVVHIRQLAVTVALSVAAGAFQTGLLTYFTHRDLFPSLMKASS